MISHFANYTQEGDQFIKKVAAELELSLRVNVKRSRREARLFNGCIFIESLEDLPGLYCYASRACIVYKTR